MTRRFSACVAALLAPCCFALCDAQTPFTLRQVLSAPYATSLTAAPVGSRFAWVEDAEGRHNLWVGGPGETSRTLTHSTEDDAQEISALAWSPDGNSIAYVRGAAIGADGKPANPAHLQPAPKREIWVQALTGGEAQRVDEGGAPLWLPGGKQLLYTKGGQVWMADLAALSAPEHGHSQVLFDRGSDSQLTLSPDGSLLAFVSRRTHDHSYIGLFDLRTKALRFLSPGTGVDSAPEFSPDGKQVAWIRVPFNDAPEFAANRTSGVPWSIQVAEVGSGEARTVFMPEANKKGSVIPHLATGEPKVFWTADGRIVFYAEMDGWLHLYMLEPKQPNAPQLMTPGSFEVDDAVLSADRKTMLYASNELPDDDPRFAQAMATGRADITDMERRHLWRLDLTQAAPKPVRVSSGTGIEARPQVAPDGKAIAALVSDTHVPMHPVLVGAGGKLTDLRPDSAPKDYPAAKLVTPEQVFFLSSDRLFKLHGQLFLPKGDAGPSASLRDNKRKELRDDKREDHHKRPAILFFHGGPRRQMLLGYPSMDYYSNAYAMNQYLTSRGFIVLSVNYRCGIGYGMEFRQCEHSGADGASEYNDALGAVTYLRTRPDVNTSRIGIWGGSYGGYFTALALARNSDIFAAGVDFHGVHDWILEDNRDDWLRGSNAEKDAIAARAHASSPMADIDRWRSPVLLIHGDNDPDVAYKQTPVLAEALKVRNVPVEELIFPDELHGFLLHKDWLAAYEAEAQFFERTLHPDAPAGAAGTSISAKPIK